MQKEGHRGSRTTFTGHIGHIYRVYDKEDFLEYLSCLDGDVFHATVDPNVQWLFIYDAISYYLDICCPVKTITIRKKSDPCSLMGDPCIIELINDSSNMLKEYTVTKDKDLFKSVRKFFKIAFSGSWKMLREST